MKIYGAPYETVTVECRSAKIMVVWIVAASAEACITLLHIALLCSPVLLLLHSTRALVCRQERQGDNSGADPCSPWHQHYCSAPLDTSDTRRTGRMERVTNIRKKRWTDLHPHTFTQKLELCHHLLTLMPFHTCMAFFFYEFKVGL